jgi:prepilin-type N-terminal cleavage/methylation domain-containing protein
MNPYKYLLSNLNSGKFPITPSPHHPITPSPQKKFFPRVIGFLKRVGKLFIENRKHLPKDTPMNSTFKFKLIQALNKKNGNKGFTLIELLVVVIIIGVLAAIALPNLLGQVARGRQAEARNNLGAINRGQQSIRLESGTFESLANLPVVVTSTYYQYDGPNSASATGAVTNATAIDTYTNDIRDYSGGVGQTSAGVFSSAICETSTPTNALVSATTTDGSVVCPSGSKKIQ